MTHWLLIFANFSSAFLQFRLNFEDFEKEKTLIADVFGSYRLRKTWFKEISEKSRFRKSFNKRHGKRSQMLLKSEGQQLYHKYWWLWRQLSYKKSLLVIRKILGLFVNTLTADDKYSLVNRDNLMQHIQMQLPPKEKTFSEFLFCIFEI